MGGCGARFGVRISIAEGLSASTLASETVKEAKVDAETLQALVDVPKGSEIYILKVRALGTGDYTDSEWSRNTVLTPEPKPTNIEFADAVLEKYLLSMQPSIDLDG